MYSQEEIYEKVVEIVSEVSEFETEEISPDTHLLDELDVDSLMGLEILVMVEKEFGIKLAEQQLQHMTTSDKITQLILAAQTKKVAAA